MPFLKEPAMKNIEAKKHQRCGVGLRLLLVAATLCVVAMSAAPPAAAGDRPTALTESGVVVGRRTGTMNEFLGIPYAAPPVGALRWRPPKRYGFFPGHIFQATQFGSECAQPGGSSSEDCLFLNVFTPLSDSGHDGAHGLPVMVYIHGGGLQIGGGDGYNPVRLLKQGVIVVTINYRLGYLGFLAQSAIDAEDHLKGNYGFMDQQFALKWVYRNITGFGGDPDQVTIFGESAGGQSVYAQLASPLAVGLFRGAIAESGSYWEFQDYFPYIVTLAQAEAIGTAVVPSGAAIAESVGCKNQKSSCLRAVAASTMVAQEPFPIFPFVDGALLTQTIEAAFASGQFNRVPVISGTNHDEWRLFAANYDLSGTPILTSAEYETAVTAQWGSNLGPLVLALYPYSSYPSGGEALGASGTDGIFSCPARNAHQSLSKFVTTYAYEFNDENAPPAQSFFGGLLTFPLGAYHTAELQYLFDGLDLFGGPPLPLSQKQIQLSEAMVSYWTQFAKTGNPNSSLAPEWAPYSPAVDQFQSLIPPTPVVESNFDAAHLCSEFWDTF
jgi:para-nitrobenzyl esterase